MLEYLLTFEENNTGEQTEISSVEEVQSSGDSLAIHRLAAKSEIKHLQDDDANGNIQLFETYAITTTDFSVEFPEWCVRKTLHGPGSYTSRCTRHIIITNLLSNRSHRAQ